MGAYFPPPSYFLNVVVLDSMKLIEKRPFKNRRMRPLESSFKKRKDNAEAWRQHGRRKSRHCPQFINAYFQVNKEDVQGLSHAKVIGMLRKITGTVELEINRYY